MAIETLTFQTGLTSSTKRNRPIADEAAAAAFGNPEKKRLNVKSRYNSLRKVMCAIRVACLYPLALLLTYTLPDANSNTLACGPPINIAFERGQQSSIFPYRQWS